MNEHQAIVNIQAYLRDMSAGPDWPDAEQVVAQAPLLPPDGGSPGAITLGDLKAIVDLLEFQPAAQELTAICQALGCVDKPGVPLKHVLDLIDRKAKAYAREIEVLKMWDKASPTERQELDRFRRGWGPSSPTERELRRRDVASALQAVSIAMTEVSVSEEECDDVPEEARTRLDEAHGRLSHAHTSLLAVLRVITEDPQEWPDIRAAEERGARAMRKVLIEMVDGLEIIEPAQGWTMHNRAIIEAGQIVRNAPLPHDYHGTAREGVQAVLSKTELPIPAEFKDIKAAEERGAMAAGFERVRHLKRGTEYEVLGEAELLVSTDSWGPRDNRRAYDGDSITVYRGTDGKLLVRFTDEFRDGRFETISAPDTRQSETIAAELEEIAGKATEAAMESNTLDGGLALLKRARTYRKLAEVMRRPGFGGQEV